MIRYNQTNFHPPCILRKVDYPKGLKGCSWTHFKATHGRKRMAARQSTAPAGLKFKAVSNTLKTGTDFLRQWLGGQRYSQMEGKSVILLRE